MSASTASFTTVPLYGIGSTVFLNLGKRAAERKAYEITLESLLGLFDGIYNCGGR